MHACRRAEKNWEDEKRVRSRKPPRHRRRSIVVIIIFFPPFVDPIYRPLMRHGS